MRRLSPETRRHLRDRLGGEGTALAFSEAVTAQIAHPLGARGSDGDELEAADRVVDLLALASGGGGEAERAAAEMALDPILLAALFQNVDLLYEHGFPRADAVGLLIMKALEKEDFGDG